MAQSKLSFLKRCSVAWSILWSGYIPEMVPEWATMAPEWIKKINVVLGSPEGACAKKAFLKLKNQPQSYPDRLNLYEEGAGSAKREQVLEYARQFLDAQGYKDINEWSLNFALEYVVGREKGFI